MLRFRSYSRWRETRLARCRTLEAKGPAAPAGMWEGGHMERAKQVSESIELGIILALVGGFMDVYSYMAVSYTHLGRNGPQHSSSSAACAWWRPAACRRPRCGMLRAASGNLGRARRSEVGLRAHGARFSYSFWFSPGRPLDPAIKPQFVEERIRGALGHALDQYEKRARYDDRRCRPHANRAASASDHGSSSPVPARRATGFG